MKSNKPMEITQELLQIFIQFFRLRWQQIPPQGLKSSESDLIGILYLNLGEGAEAITASDLSDQLNITPAGVTHLLNPLEEDGYIERLKDPHDRRVVLVGLTGKGRKLAETLIEEAHESLAGLVKYLGEEDSRTLIRVMSSVIEYLMAHPAR